MLNIFKIFKPSYTANNMQKNIIYSEKNNVSYIHKILSWCLPLNSCKSFNLFTNNENISNINIFNKTEDYQIAYTEAGPLKSEIMYEETILNKVSNYDENYDNIDNTYMLNIYRNIDDFNDINDINFSSEKLIINKKIRDREAILNLFDKSLHFYDNKKLMLNLSDNNEKNFSKNNSFSKKKIYDKNKKLIFLDDKKVYINNPKYRKTYIFEEHDFF